MPKTMANDTATAIPVVLRNLEAIFRLLEMRKRVGGKSPNRPKQLRSQDTNRSIGRSGFGMKNMRRARRAARKLDGSHDHWLTLVSSGQHLLLGTVTVGPRRGRLASCSAPTGCPCELSTLSACHLRARGTLPASDHPRHAQVGFLVGRKFSRDILQKHKGLSKNMKLPGVTAVPSLALAGGPGKGLQEESRNCLIRSRIWGGEDRVPRPAASGHRY